MSEQNDEVLPEDSSGCTTLEIQDIVTKVAAGHVPQPVDNDD